MRSGPTQQDQELQCETTEEGTLWCVAHRLIKIQAGRNLMAQQVSLFPSLCISCGEARLSPVLHWVSGVLVRGHVLCKEPDSAIFFSLSP